MGYEVLKKHWTASHDKPVVSFGVRGIIYLNSAVMNLHFKNVKFVDLLYDDKKRSLAIKPVKEMSQNSYKLKATNPQEASTSAIACRSILKKLKIELTEKKQYIPTWNTQGKFLEIKL
jgi:hypothetical protein